VRVKSRVGGVRSKLNAILLEKGKTVHRPEIREWLKEWAKENLSQLRHGDTEFI